MLFKVDGEKDTAFLMMNAYNNNDKFLDSQGTADAHTTIKISSSYADSLEETNRVMTELLAYVSDYRQIYIGAHYYSEPMWKDALASSQKIRAIFVGDAHTENDTTYYGNPLFIDGGFYHSFNHTYGFRFNYASEPLAYMMLETYGDTAEGYRVHPDVVYDIANKPCAYFSQSWEKTDEFFGTTNVYSKMTHAEYALAAVAYTLSAMEEKGGAFGYLEDAEGNRLKATLETSTGIVTVVYEESGAAYDGTVYYHTEYCRYVLNGTTVESGVTKDGVYGFSADEKRIKESF